MKKQIKTLLLLLCVLAILIAVPACNKKNKNSDDDTTPAGDTITTPQNNGKLFLILNETDITIGVNEDKKLTVTSSLTGMETSGVLWISDDPSIATVDTSGNVKGIKDGNTIITVKSIDGEAEAQCAVKVTSKVSGVNIHEDRIQLELGNTIDLKYDIFPANASNKKVHWSTEENNGVVSVSENGVITPLAPGTATVSIKTDEGGYYDSCDVEVIISVKSISLVDTDITVNKRVDYNLKYNIFPANATETELEWKSSNEDVALVSDGKVIPIRAGNATITVTAESGVSASCHVTVYSPVTGVTVSPQVIRLKKWETKILTATVSPDDASEKYVTWASSDSSIATVNHNGVVTGVKASATSVIITARTADGEYQATCEVWVSNPLSSITFDKTKLTLSVFDNPVTITPTFYPLDADNISTVTWSTTNKMVATVDDKGVVTPVGSGTADIILSTSDGVKAVCTVTVPEISKTPVSSITIETRYVILKAGEKHRPMVVLLPEQAYDKTYVLESDDPSIVRVEADGSITAISKGTVTITVRSVQNPDVTEYFRVTVNELTKEDIDATIIKYQTAIQDENDRYAAALDKIENHYSYLLKLKADLEEQYPGFNEEVYTAQKAEIEKNIDDYNLALAEAEALGDQELVAMYNDLIAKEQEKLTALEKMWKDYFSAIEIYNEENAKYLSEKAAEEQLNIDNIAKINNDYEYILPYLPAT